MGKRNSQRKNAAILDADEYDDNSSVSSSSTIRSDRMSMMENEEMQVDRDSLLDQALEALYEKRGSTRENALTSIIGAFNTTLQHEFVENKFATLLERCLSSFKRGSPKEICLASHAIGLLALTLGFGDNAREILDESLSPLSQALKSGSESSKISLLECLAIITFVGGTDPEQTEKSMQIMWQVVHPKLGSNVVAVKPSGPVISAMVSAWSFLLTTMDGWKLNPKDWQESLSYLSSLLEKDDRAVRIAAGEALALIFEIGSLEKFSAAAKGPSDGSTEEGSKPREFVHIQGLKTKIINQVRNLSTEAGGKGSVKKDLNNQRNLFRDLLEYIEDGYCPEGSVKIGGESLETSTWSKLIQLNFLKRFLGGGFVKHMQENEFLHDVFGFTPKKYVADHEHRLSSSEKVGARYHSTRVFSPVISKHKSMFFLLLYRMYRSPNSVLNKARTQHLNKQRMLSEGKNIGHFAVNRGDEEAWS